MPDWDDNWQTIWPTDAQVTAGEADWMLGTSEEFEDEKREVQQLLF